MEEDKEKTMQDKLIESSENAINSLLENGIQNEELETLCKLTKIHKYARQEKHWEEVYNELTDLSGDVGLLFNNVKFVEDYLDERYPRECHYSKTVEEFAKENPYGKYAVTMNGHITAIINGNIIDSFDPSKRIIRCAWKINE